MAYFDEVTELDNGICGETLVIPTANPTGFFQAISESHTMPEAEIDRDEWCSPQQVQAHMHAIRLCGGRASCRIFPDAHHGFDRDTPVETIEEATVAPGAPTVYIREDGALMHPLAREADPDLSERDVMVYAMKSGHGRRGARLGSSGGQVKQFHRDMMGFWEALMLGTAD